jgi:hypothetical protein
MIYTLKFYSDLNSNLGNRGLESYIVILLLLNSLPLLFRDNCIRERGETGLYTAVALLQVLQLHLDQSLFKEKIIYITIIKMEINKQNKSIVHKKPYNSNVC